MCAALLAACGPATTAPGANPYPAEGDHLDRAAEKALLTPMPPSDAPEPAPGMASVSGALFSYTIQRLIPDTMFYFTPAEGPDRNAMPVFLAGPDSARGDITGRSDAVGNFAAGNLPAGNYFLVVSAPYNWCPAETAPENPAPLLLQVNTGDKIALGVAYVSWP